MLYCTVLYDIRVSVVADESRSKSLSDPSKSVFAHFFLDTRQYEEQHSGKKKTDS